MELILDILYIYVVLYTIYFLALAIRNLNDKNSELRKNILNMKTKTTLQL